MGTTQFWLLRSKALVVVAFAAMLVPASWAASNGKLVYSFTGGDDGGDPASGLVFDTVGNAYGTTVVGGTFGCGTVFQLTPLANGKWRENVLWVFNCVDGKNPYGGVTLDASGNLYGTTVAGGSGGACVGDGCGTVYELTESGTAWSKSVLYNFTGEDDGFGPGGGVAFDSVGNLYGTTPDGGQYSSGVVYELSLTQNGQWQQTVIHAFTGGADGSVGSLGLLLFHGGNFYGVSELGGVHSAGTVFQLSPVSGGGWKFSTLYAFKGQPDAAFPYGGLIADAAGSLYGTSYFGGASGAGAVFKLDATLKKEVVLYSFKGGTDGSNPTSTLVFDMAGNLYGTATAGGDPGCACGTVFELSPGKETTLHRFTNSPDGASPGYGLSPDPKGNLFSTTLVGGAEGQGIVFSFTP